MVKLPVVDVTKFLKSYGWILTEHPSHPGSEFWDHPNFPEFTANRNYALDLVGQGKCKIKISGEGAV